MSLARTWFTPSEGRRADASALCSMRQFALQCVAKIQKTDACDKRADASCRRRLSLTLYILNMQGERASVVYPHYTGSKKDRPSHSRGSDWIHSTAHVFQLLVFDQGGLTNTESQASTCHGVQSHSRNAHRSPAARLTARVMQENPWTRRDKNEARLVQARFCRPCAAMPARRYRNCTALRADLAQRCLSVPSSIDA
ncbi:hypothetical protein FVE85_8752 [Porphyridium purpureum]|uniref:Uncharacterized protein n=1 Tax=Porphyridium purpureum TaxID=35688 RepID=A0A5J4YS97_PORPP|nr:hypothetical protein FVE85_8752 [Porphyridium purpureum]|eukprot:POR8433..scf296_7